MSAGVLFVVRSRRGLGHVMRSKCVAEGLQSLRSDARVALAVSHRVPDALIGDVPQIVVGQSQSARDNEAIVSFGSDVVVFDTLMPADWDSWLNLRPRPRFAFMMREMTWEALATLRDHPAFALMDRILIPHLRSEFDPGIKGAVHVGTIARGHGRSVARGPGAMPLVVSTAGGGGHSALCEPFIAMCLEADRQLRADALEFEHRLVMGPRFSGAVPDAGRVHLSRFEPDLPSIMAEADLVVARAGYNTVNELEMIGGRAILVPGNPGLDDQRRRAERAARSDAISIVEPGDVEGLVAQMRADLAREASVPRSTPAQQRWTPGAFTAAHELLSLCDQRVLDAGDEQSIDSVSASGVDDAVMSDRTLIDLLTPVVDPSETNASPLQCTREDVSYLRSTGKLERIRFSDAHDELGVFYAKSLSAQRNPNLFDRMRAVQDDAPFARAVAYIEHRETLIVEEARGTRLDLLLRRSAGEEFGPDAHAGMRALGAALVRLHALQSAMFERITVESLLQELDPAPSGLPEWLRGPAEEVANWLQTAPDPIDQRAVLCHRDLHPRQVFVAGSRVSMIDLDHAGMAHPAIDLANATVYLEHKFGAPARALTQSLGTGYERAGGVRDAVAENLYGVFTRLRLVAKQVRSRQPGWERRAEVLMDAARSRCQAQVGIMAVGSGQASLRGASR